MGWLNSQTTSRPPGLVTRASSRSAASTSTTLRRAKEMVTASKAPSGERQLERVTGEQRYGGPRATAGLEHADRQVGADGVRPGPGQFLGRHPGAGAHVEHPLPRAQREGGAGGPPPAPVLPEGQDGVGQVVPRPPPRRTSRRPRAAACPGWRGSRAHPRTRMPATPVGAAGIRVACCGSGRAVPDQAWVTIRRRRAEKNRTMPRTRIAAPPPPMTVAAGPVTGRPPPPPLVSATKTE